MTGSVKAAVAALVLVAAAGCATSPPAVTGPNPTPVATSNSPTPPPKPSPSPRLTPVRVAIFGDSQATALYTTRPPGVAKQLTLSDHSISACGILRGQVTSRSGERFNLVSACPNWLSKWRSEAKRVKPDIALVVIGAWDVLDLKTSTGTLVFATPEWDANFLSTLRGGLDALRESGAQIALAELPCYRPHQSNPTPPGWWPERGDDDRVAHVNDLLRQVADDVHIFTVKPASQFCTDPAVGDNKKNRYDGVHYLRPGATLFFDAVTPQLVNLPT